MGFLTPDMRAEIVRILRGSKAGLSHGAIFQLMEQGLTDSEISAKRKNVSVATIRRFKNSLDQLLSGKLPTSSSAAKTNSTAYRELLNHPLSPELESYVKARLYELHSMNPDEVKFTPLETRDYQYRDHEARSADYERGTVLPGVQEDRAAAHR